MNKCTICKKEISDSEAYEYRGAISCEEHFDGAIEKRDREREEIISRQNSETEIFKGLDFGEGAIGETNRKILGGRIKQYKKAVKHREY